LASPSARQAAQDLFNLIMTMGRHARLVKEKDFARRSFDTEGMLRDLAEKEDKFRQAVKETWASLCKYASPTPV
jgi:hypothetical protein